MRTVEEKRFCDVCDKEIKLGDMPSNDENHQYAILTFRVSVYYGGIHAIQDICQACNDKIIKLLMSKRLLEHMQKEGK